MDTGMGNKPVKVITGGVSNNPGLKVPVRKLFIHGEQKEEESGKEEKK